jgi:hypothetical protein
VLIVELLWCELIFGDSEEALLPRALGNTEPSTPNSRAFDYAPTVGVRAESILSAQNDRNLCLSDKRGGTKGVLEYTVEQVSDASCCKDRPCVSFGEYYLECAISGHSYGGVDTDPIFPDREILQPRKQVTR